MSGFRQLRGPLLLLAFTLALGVVGYSVIEGWSFLDALFMTVTTVTTVGYQEVHPLSRAGEVFTIFLILIGVGGVLYTLTSLFAWLVSIDLPEQRRKRLMESRLAQLSNHFIVCGYGRVGMRVAEVLRRENVSTVIIDVNQQSLADAEADGFLVVHGDAASDPVLKRAGIDRAHGLIAATDSDADNVYVVLSAHGLRPDMLIIARANAEDAIQKLERAGATHALSPYNIAGRRMAMLAIRPTAVEFVETVLHSGRERLMLEEVIVEPGSRLAGKSIGELRHQFEGGPVIAGLRHDGVLSPSPPDDYTLHPGDEIVLIGSPENLKQVERLS
ncbi:MAG TPA: potassium channel protein [Chloroflexota bacterium]|nr:potassium channel protein [Chloroflexota bacterium]